MNGPCIVTAVPGAGKTHSLTLRFKKLMEQGVRPNRILCCTFTKKAAIEMKERITASVKSPFFSAPYIGTMHSIFFAMLSDHPDLAKFKRIAVIHRDYTRLKYVIDIAKELGDKFANIDTKGLFQKISLAKNELLGPDEMRLRLCEETGETAYPVGPGCGNIWDYYQRYEEKKAKVGAIDYDDMLLKTWEMFQMYPDILEKWQNQFQYIMIDEFQDINLAQWEIIKMLVETHSNLFVVGDANQSIYGFRGSKPEFLYNFKNEMNGAKIIHMSRNYRSGDDIISLANKVARHTEYFMSEIEGIGKKGTVDYVNYQSEEIQAREISKKIQKLIASGVEPKDIGIIFRTNDCAGMIEINFANDKIPFKSRSGHGFFSSKIVKDVMAYLDSSYNDMCESSLSRIINVPNRFLGKAFKTRWAEIMDQFSMKPKEALLMEYDHQYWEKNAKDIYYHLQFLQDLSGDAQKAVKYIREDVGYDAYLMNDSSELGVDQGDMLSEIEYIADRQGNVRQMLEMANEVIKNPHAEDDNAVLLTTIHGSKGLEFEHVFLISLIAGIIPHKRSEKDEKAKHEERRMFFVGVTRAKRVLHLSSFGGSDGNIKPSEFLEECSIHE